MILNRKGFTLVELLVTIVIIGLVIGLSVFGIISLINNSKDKVKVLSENNLKEAARIYSSEASSDSWKKNNDYDSFCVTIGELMNKGLLDEKAQINGNLTRNDMIIVKRNKVTLSVDSEEIVSRTINETNNEICTGQVINSENVTAPQINGSDNYTDRIEINFTNGTADSGIKNYECIYGITSGNMNLEGTISGNKCIMKKLKHNTTYYVFIYMNTNNGSSVLADGSREYKTKNFNEQKITQNKNIVNITYDNTNIYNNPKHYFYSSAEGITNVTVEKCTLKNNKFNCNGSTNDIENNKWYRVNENTINITYAEKSNNIEITARIEDSTNNYREDTNNVKIVKYTVKFYKNKASSIDGKTNEYIEKFCMSDGNSTCSVVSPSITPPNGYEVVGFNTSSSAATSTWNVNTSKEINSNLSYYAIIKAIVYTITYDLKGGNVSGNPTTYTVESDDITLKNPTRTGYTFTGWTGTNGTTKQTTVTINKGSTGNKNYTANWSANEYTYNIVYKSSTGIQLGTSTAKYKYNTTNTISPKSFTGYTSPSSQSIKWDSTSAKTITFTYTPISYSISYNLNDGTVSGNPTSYTIENSITLKKPTRSGYTFTGWTGTGISSLTQTVTIPKGNTGNRSYTANWQADGLFVNDDVDSVLNCRSYIGGPSVEKYVCGTHVSGYYYNDSWYFHNAGNCYLSTDYLSTIRSCTYYPTETLHCRTGPGTGYSIHDTYSCGTKIIGYPSDTDGWTYYPAENCYLNTSYLSSTVPSCGGGGGGGTTNRTCTCVYNGGATSVTVSCSVVSSYGSCSSYCYQNYNGNRGNSSNC